MRGGVVTLSPCTSMYVVHRARAPVPARAARHRSADGRAICRLLRRAARPPAQVHQGAHGLPRAEGPAQARAVLSPGARRHGQLRGGGGRRDYFGSS